MTHRAQLLEHCSRASTPQRAQPAPLAFQQHTPHMPQRFRTRPKVSLLTRNSARERDGGGAVQRPRGLTQLLDSHCVWETRPRILLLHHLSSVRLDKCGLASHMCYTFSLWPFSEHTFVNPARQLPYPWFPMELGSLFRCTCHTKSCKRNKILHQKAVSQDEISVYFEVTHIHGTEVFR
jgi:hypothetical protein